MSLEEPYEVGDVEIPAKVNGVTVHASLRSLSPVIPSKEYHIVRLLKKTAYGALIVDVEKVPREGDEDDEFVSGCRVEAISNTESKVTFVVQRSYKINDVQRGYENLMKTAFSSARWFATLKRECKRIAIHNSFSSSDEKYKRMVERARIMRDQFSSLLTVEGYEASAAVQVPDPRDDGLCSALSSIRVEAPYEETFKICKELIIAEKGQGGVEIQIPQNVDNCVSLILSVSFVFFFRVARSLNMN